MDDYEMITRLGGGSFADVYKAKEKSTGELVAIKVLKRKYKKWEDCLELRECSSLQKLHDVLIQINHKTQTNNFHKKNRNT
jgi:serine/threonine protein kinase